MCVFAAVTRSLATIQEQLSSAVNLATDSAVKDGIANILHTKVSGTYNVCLHGHFKPVCKPLWAIRHV